MGHLYEKDAQDNYVRTGQYILGSYMEKDGIHCSKFHELVNDWIKGNYNEYETLFNDLGSGFVS